MERADLRAGGHRRCEDLGPERAAGVDHRLAAVHPERRRPAGAIASSGTARMISSTSSRIGSGSAKTRVTSTSERNRSRRPASRLATAWIGQPPRLRATPSAVPTAPAPTIPMIGGSPGLGVACGWAWSLGWVVVAVAVRARRRRVEVDPGRLDGGLRLGPIGRVSVGIVARAGRPRPSSGSSGGSPDRRYVHASSVAAVVPGRPEVRRVYSRQPRPGAGAPARRRLTPRTGAVDEGGAS